MTMTPIKITEEEIDWELYDRIIDMEREWRKSLPKLIDKELLEVFPEAKVILPQKIREREEERDEIAAQIKQKLALMKGRVRNEAMQVLWREWLKITDGEKLLEIENHIARLRRLSTVAKGRVPKGRFTEEQIKQASVVPIERLIDRPMRKSGRLLVGLCPFHNERHPSFHIYPETNSCWCYGCGQGGDAIKFVQLLHGYDFKEAVQYLIGK